MLGNRSVITVLRSVLDRRHYIALWQMYRLYPDFWGNFRRYLFASGEYPCRMDVRTPSGPLSITLYSHHDLLTVNEIFCRQDYQVDHRLDVVVDLGSNIGISALYFLTRNRSSRCYLFEPDPRNLARLRANLKGFEARFELHEVAVADFTGRCRFGIENSGRYGGIGVETGDYLEVDCRDINDVLAEVLAEEPVIDLLKIDTEGVEIRTAKAIRPEFLSRIRRIYLESQPAEPLHQSTYRQVQYGGVRRLYARNSSAEA